MAITNSNLVNTTTLNGVPTPIITSTNTIRIHTCSFHNTGAEDIILTLYIVASGETASSSNQSYVESITAGSQLLPNMLLNVILTTGMTLQASQTGGSTVNVNASGIEIT